MAVRHQKEPLDLDLVISDNKQRIIAILYEIQKHYRYLPEDVLRELSVKINKPPIEIYRIATFYKLFSLKKKGRHQVTVCTGTACHVRGSEQLVEDIAGSLCVCRGETSADGEYSLTTVNCLGACARGPLVEVDGEYHGNVTSKKLKIILKKLKSGETSTDQE
ncbi:MAG: NAD(P)H-dependent oxidoreductase subunit E [Dethiobacter sp.]|jgi:NADH-quinone oxidoreductase subunit E|nr:NAD(P)H-dependent oxidoreductase subunit E [Dethiobacter sp.]